MFRAGETHCLVNEQGRVVFREVMVRLELAKKACFNIRVGGWCNRNSAPHSPSPTLLNKMQASFFETAPRLPPRGERWGGGGRFPHAYAKTCRPLALVPLGHPAAPPEFKAEFHASLIQAGTKLTLNCFGRIAGGVFHDFWGFFYFLIRP